MTGGFGEDRFVGRRVGAHSVDADARHHFEIGCDLTSFGKLPSALIGRERTVGDSLDKEASTASPEKLTVDRHWGVSQRCIEASVVDGRVVHDEASDFRAGQDRLSSVGCVATCLEGPETRPLCP